MAMMNRIGDDMKSAMKARDKIRLETLRTLRAALMEKEIERRGSDQGMTPEDELAVLMNAAKKRKESIEMFGKGGRTDLVEQEEKELTIIQEYLPKMMLAEEIEGIVDDIVRETGATSVSDFAKVMPVAMKHLKGKAEGKLVQEIVRKRLGG